MLKERDTLLTIGQFAKLHDINKKTLMWYDEIGILKPYCIKENGYRYYSYQQSATLETILMFRELNVSLKEIREFMENRTVNGLDLLLKEKTEELNETINHLKSIRKVLESHRQEMKTLKNLDLSSIQIVKKPERYLAKVDTSATMSFDEEVRNIILETKKHQLRRLHDASYGVMISVDHLYREEFDQYAALYIELPHTVIKKGLHRQPAGMYLEAFHKGNWESLPQCYQKIMKYAKKHNLTLEGYAYETGINELVINDLEDYITRIEIPISNQKKKAQ